MTVMNTMMGLQLLEFKNDVDKAMAKGAEKDEAILMVLKNYIRKSKVILFEGNNYSDEWREEAATRGLSNHTNTPEALDVLGTKLAQDFFGKSGVLNKTELEAFLAVQLHGYCTKLDIEAKTLEDMVNSIVMPAVLRYQTELADNIASMRDIGLEDAVGYQKETLQRIIKAISTINGGLKKMHEALEKVHHSDDLRKEADILCNSVKPEMETIRAAVDDLEGIVDDQYWPLVKYRELLFVR